jgi:hypothetical protein
MSDQMTFWVLPSSTPSQESVSGPTPSVSPGGLMSGQSGPGLVRANRLATQERAEGSTTPATSGLSGCGLSASAALQRSLESRLRAELAGRGSILYRMTWRPWAMPSGRRLCRLVASALPISDSGSSSWPTPMKADAERKSEKFMRGNLTMLGAARCAGWPTPTSSLADKGVRTREGAIRECARNKGPDLGAVAALASGTPPNGSHVPTVAPGQLSPGLPRWLMGLPVEWDKESPGWVDWSSAQEQTAQADSKDTATPSTPK